MKVGELRPTKEQIEGIKKANEERTRIVKIVEENYNKRPYPKRVKK